ncbi:beta-lactamase/transpeptidase-like protein [Lasiosphaeria hispida]|uniref:Beta-lactamase/transpeptidase-like protein n=1 Tax=Lasiosphaeria hispida TaxID=260671 RepID=A0AAJ0HA16_9PEZI|nr:beta-lactamase/transpeptidase-like protein [Lasiosphaeria hispida]
MRPFSSSSLAWIVVASQLGAAQNCPILGPAYPAVTNIAAPKLTAAKARFEKALESVNRSSTSFAIQVYSAHDDGLIYSTYNTATDQVGAAVVGPDTIWRLFSISKAITVYTFLARLGDVYWNEPITKFIPELADAPVHDPIRDVNWAEVTLGSLAGQSSGLTRDYSLRDSSAVQSQIPGFRTLKDSEIVKCGSFSLPTCNRTEAIRIILKTYPWATSYRTPNYSTMAFQLLAYAAENITGESFPDIIMNQLIKPLNLTRTSVPIPQNDTNVVNYSADAWGLDIGDLSPGGGYSASASDLSTLGKSILRSTLLPPILTRRWLAPAIHSGSLLFSMGRPWEILRHAVPATLTSNITRHVDIYTKQGGGGAYTTAIALSPDHDIGVSIMTSGDVTQAVFNTITRAFLDIWLGAAEEAARDQAQATYEGTYASKTPGDNSSVVVGLSPGEPALFVEQVISNGTDILEYIVNNNGALSGREGKVGLWLYPMGLVDEKEKSGGGGRRVAFRGWPGLVGEKPAEDCGSWAESDRLRWGNYPGDLYVFEVDQGGKASAVENPGLGRVFWRV